MKKMRKWVVILTILAIGIVLSWSVASAYPTLPEFWKFKFDDFELLGPEIPVGQDQANGTEDNWGVFRVTSIIDRLNNTTTWSDGQGGWQITGIFYKIDIDDVAIKGAGYTINSTNRIIQPQLDLYIQNTADPGYTAFDPTGGPAARTGLNTYPTITDGTLLVSGLFMPGILPTAFPAPYADVAPFDPTDTVINLDIDLLTGPFTGDGAGYLDVVLGSGPWSSIMDTNSFILPIDTNNDGITDTNVIRDIYMEFDIRPHPDPGLPIWGWTVNSEDPAFGLAAVPEPSTLILLGAGLLGCGAFARRRMKK